MASFLDKIKVNSAVDSRTKLDLGCDHISTASWMQYNVAYNKELVPREKIDVNMETFTRLLPLVRPTFGRANVNNRAFFVPYRTIFDGWNDFITDTNHIAGGHAGSNLAVIGTAVPYFTNQVLLQFLTNINYATMYDEEDVDEERITVWDFMFEYSSNVYKYCVLTQKGRQAMKILNSLGYVPQFQLGDTTKYNALPLMAIAKIYIDWYFPTQYVGVNTTWNSVANILFNHTGNGIVLTDSDLKAIFDLICYVQYDADYFTAAWDNPNAPSSTTFSRIDIVNIDNGTSYKSAATNYDTGTNTYKQSGSPTLGVNNAGAADYAFTSPVVASNISQYILHALHALTDYMKRHQLVGAKALDRYLARFGVELSAEKTNRSLYLGNYKVPIQIGDIMSSADTNNAGLGDYAGKAMGYGQGHFDYETDEYGQFIIISTIIPAAGLYQGIDRNVLHVAKTDFWTPEFDNLGVQAIAQSELYVSWNNPKDIAEGTVNGTNSAVFGFIPKYAEYKVAKDKITGDFRYSTINLGEDTWYLNRDMTGWVADNQSIVHGQAFIEGRDWSQYNRIFQNAFTDVDGNEVAVDPFKVIYHFEIASYSPMKALFDTYEFEDKGKKVTENVNGVKMN